MSEGAAVTRPEDDALELNDSAAAVESGNGPAEKRRRVEGDNEEGQCRARAHTHTHTHTHSHTHTHTTHTLLVRSQRLRVLELSLEWASLPHILFYPLLCTLSSPLLCCHRHVVWQRGHSCESYKSSQHRPQVHLFSAPSLTSPSFCATCTQLTRWTTPDRLSRKRRDKQGCRIVRWLCCG
jgi:hypothetical protein